MISTREFLNELARTIKVGFPSFKQVNLERIDKISYPALSVEIVDRRTSNVDPYRSYKSLTLDLIYWNGSNKISPSLDVMDRLEALFSLGLHVKDRFIKVEEPPEMKFVDQDLHCLLTFGWYDSAKILMATEGREERVIPPELNPSGVEEVIPAIPPRIVEHVPGETDIKNTKDDATNKKIEEEAPHTGSAEQDWRTMELLFMEIK